jgi:HK97 family phage major capsid protein
MNERLALLEKRAESLKMAREIHEKAVEEKRDLSQEEQNNYNQAVSDYKMYDGQIKQEERKDQLHQMNTTLETREHVRVNSDEIELRKAFANFIRQGNNSPSENAYRALQKDSATQAGYLVAPQSFMSELIQDLYKMTFFRQKARILPPLTKSESLGVPKKTANMSSAAWGSEIGAPTADSALTFGKREFRPHPATAEILVSKTLIRTAAISPESIVREEMAHDFANLMETAYFTGDGVSKPLGVFTASDNGISTSQDVSTGNTATTITFDGLIEAKYKIVKTAYWPNLEWYFHPDAVKMLAKIKDSEGQYVWRSSVVAGEPDMLLSFPVNMSEFVPNTFTASQYVGLLGSLKDGYYIVDSLNMEIQALYELYARSNQVDFIGRIESDGCPVKDECFARIKLAAS